MPQRRKSNRVRRTESQWIEILGEFAASGLGPREFCNRKSLALASFQRWRRRVGAVAPAKFVELHPPADAVAEVAPAGAWSLDVKLPNGIALRFQG